MITDAASPASCASLQAQLASKLLVNGLLADYAIALFRNPVNRRLQTRCATTRRARSYFDHRQFREYKTPDLRGRTEGLCGT